MIPSRVLAAALSAAERRKVKEFYDNTLYSRLDDKVNGAIVIVMQRLHEDDLVGHVLEKEDWEVLTIPAIAVEDMTYQLGPRPEQIYSRQAGDLLHPDREPLEVLERIRRNLGSLNFSAQYQQNPMPAEGNVDQARVAAPLPRATRRIRSCGQLLGYGLDSRRESRTGRSARCGAP